MPEYVLTRKDTDPPQSHTLRWDERQFTLTDSQQQAPVLNLPTDRAVYQIDLEEFFGQRVGLLLEDGQKVVFTEHADAWRELHGLVEKQLREDENFRYHVHAAYRRSGWLGLGLVAASLAAGLALAIYLVAANEPKQGLWRFAHRWGLKFGFIILIGVGWTGVSLWLGAWRARRLVRNATREEEWRP